MVMILDAYEPEEYDQMRKQDKGDNGNDRSEREE
jgi:hypothetical protein